MCAREKVPVPEPMVAVKPGATAAPKEIGWLPDCVYSGGKFEEGLAFFADGAGRISRFSRDAADLALAKRLPGQAALPGLVNTHSQAWERVLRGQVDLRPRADRDATGHWREAQERMVARLTAEDIYDAARMAFLELLLSGVTCVGECHYLQYQADGSPWPEPNQSAREILRAAHDVGIRIALLNGAQVRSGFRQAAGSAPARLLTPTAEQFVRETESLRDFIEKNHPGDEAWIGVAPHSLATVPLDYLKAVANYAHAKRLRFHLHVGADAAEQAACVDEYGRTPAALLAEHGFLDKRFVALHGTHLTDEDIRILGAARVTVCGCPASELHRGEGGFPLGKLVAAGATVAVGTDGHAQTNLWEDLRLLEYQLRGEGRRGTLLPGDFAASLFQMATVVGARSLGAPGGAIEIGRPADFFTVNRFDPALVGCAPEQLLTAVMFASSPRAIREVWVGARQRVGQWRHPAQSGIVARFGELQQRLWTT